MQLQQQQQQQFLLPLQSSIPIQMPMSMPIPMQMPMQQMPTLPLSSSFRPLPTNLSLPTTVAGMTVSTPLQMQSMNPQSFSPAAPQIQMHQQQQQQLQLQQLHQMQMMQAWNMQQLAAGGNIRTNAAAPISNNASHTSNMILPAGANTKNAASTPRPTATPAAAVAGADINLLSSVASPASAAYNAAPSTDSPVANLSQPISASNPSTYTSAVGRESLSVAASTSPHTNSSVLLQFQQRLQQQSHADNQTPSIPTTSLGLQQQSAKIPVISNGPSTPTANAQSASASTSTSTSVSAAASPNSINSMAILQQQQQQQQQQNLKQQLIHQNQTPQQPGSRRTSSSRSSRGGTRMQNNASAQHQMQQQFNQKMMSEQQQLFIHQALVKQQQLLHSQQLQQQLVQSQQQPVQRQSPLPAVVPLLPSINTYMPRLKTGETGMVQLISEKKKKSKWAEDSTDDDGDAENEDGDGDDSTRYDDQNGRRRRTGKRNDRRGLTASSTIEPATSIPTVHTPSSLRHRRKLRQTNHDYAKINWCKLDVFASTKEVLVPIKLDFDLDGFRVRDAFTWNLNEPMITPEKFAEYMCLDMDLDQTIYGSLISSRIRTQLDEYRRFFEFSDFPPLEDSRVPIKLNLRVGKMQLRDRFEWDLASVMPPEEFAKRMTMDLRLGGEFAQMIAFSIREQVHRFRRDGEIEATFAIEKPFRAEEEARSWSPNVDAFQTREDDEEEENDAGKGRSSRRIRRELRTTMGSRRRTGGYAASSNVRVSIRGGGSVGHIEENSGQQVSSLDAEVRTKRKCDHCLCTLVNTSGMRAGPSGEHTLCNACGVYYQLDATLPEHRLGLFKVTAVR
ncbi:hypothetical protein BASA62_008945 [Batrachochytrium salamandrivorans]|nr:hypothetical protein BASA62_008945 [Batrachochytrium salamandrivorans]